MQIPKNIENIIKRILEGENNWKALYMARWGLVKYWLKPTFESTANWEKPIQLGLPASKREFHEYTPSQLSKILASGEKDREFTLSYLQTLLSLFEELLKEISKILFNKEINTSKWKDIEKFFKQQKAKDILSPEELKELKLLKKTRNCFIHNDSKIDKEWLKTYKDIKGKNCNAQEGDDLSKGFDNLFYQVEDWNYFIVEITKNLKDKFT